MIALPTLLRPKYFNYYRPHSRIFFLRSCFVFSAEHISIPLYIFMDFICIPLYILCILYLRIHLSSVQKSVRILSFRETYDWENGRKKFFITILDELWQRFSAHFTFFSLCVYSPPILLFQVHRMNVGIWIWGLELLAYSVKCLSKTNKICIYYINIFFHYSFILFDFLLIRIHLCVFDYPCCLHFFVIYFLFLHGLVHHRFFSLISSPSTDANLTLNATFPEGV